ncbi:hypothetical protein C8U37_1378, partial [Trichococcus patagoniensis]
FAIQSIVFVCFDRSLSSLHIWFVHSLFSFQRPIVYHVLRDCLFIISRLRLSVKPFLKVFQKQYRLADAWISNFYIISRSKSSVNNFFKSFQIRFWRTTSIYYHRSRMLSTIFWFFLKSFDTALGNVIIVLHPACASAVQTRRLSTKAFDFRIRKF